MVSSIPPPTQKAVDQTGFFVEPWYRALNTLGTSINDSVSGSRRLLTEGTTFYVDTSGTSNGDGSSGSPFATPQQALDWIADNIDASGWWVKILIRNGTYNVQTTERRNNDTGDFPCVLLMDREIVGASCLIIEGESAGGVTFNGFGIFMPGGVGFVRIRNIKFQGNVADDRGLFCLSAGALIVIESGCEFGAFTGSGSAHMQLYGPNMLKLFSDYTVSGGAHRHIFLEGESSLDQESSTVTITGTPAFAIWIHVNAQSHAAFLSMTWTGAATGYKYYRENGVIGIFPVVDLNSVLPGDLEGWELGADNYSGIPTEYTPALSFGGSSTGITYNVQEARYIAVGVIVHVWITINLSSKGVSTGAAKISLPVAVGNYDGTLGAVGSVIIQNANAPAGTYGTLYALADVSQSVVQIRNLTPAGSDTAVTDAEFNNNSTIYLTINYLKGFS